MSDVQELNQQFIGGVIMDVVTPEQAKIAEDAGASAVMALERVPADIRAQGFRDYRVVIDDVFGREGEPAATGRWTLSGPGPDGERHRYDGNWLMLLDGTPSARILLHMWN